jgi:small-conductance mechanosensitive channel
MNSLKSISSGVSFIFIASMLLQLGYIFVVVGYNSVAKNYPFLKDIDWIFQYLLTMPIVILIMFFGGYLAAAIAKYKVIIHSFLVGFITLVVMMWMALQNAQLTSKGLINGGFMVFNKNMLDYLTEAEDCDFEFGPLEKLAAEKEVMTFKHNGFWECADTVRDVNHLNKLWNTGEAKWKLWK